MNASVFMSCDTRMVRGQWFARSKDDRRFAHLPNFCDAVMIIASNETRSVRVERTALVKRRALRRDSIVIIANARNIVTAIDRHD